MIPTRLWHDSAQSTANVPSCAALARPVPGELADHPVQGPQRGPRGKPDPEHRQPFMPIVGDITQAAPLCPVELFGERVRDRGASLCACGWCWRVSALVVESSDPGSGFEFLPEPVVFEGESLYGGFGQLDGEGEIAVGAAEFRVLALQVLEPGRRVHDGSACDSFRPAAATSRATSGKYRQNVALVRPTRRASATTVGLAPLV
ncbi:hypothetical protein [Micromonospora sp. CPCC 206061]|uniref:hypothetical protein n=1 Tax=Micromonospora sp. CPCC 206061 TaxID=3122410 RepID=UPI002FEF174B